MGLNGEVALFRLEDTLVNDTITQSIDIATAINSRRYGSIELPEDRVERMKRLQHILHRATPQLVDEFTDGVASKMPEMLPRWAGIALNDQFFNHGRKLGLYSEILTDKFVRAYADGVENSLTGVSVTFVQGAKSPADACRRFTGKSEYSSAHVLVDDLEDRYLSVEVFASGARNTLDILNEVPHPLVVNNKKDMPIHGNTFNAARLHWSPSQPSITRFAAPHNTATAYNLDRPLDLITFVEDINQAL